MGNEVARSCGGGPNHEEMKKIQEYDLINEEKMRIAEELETNKKLANDYIAYKSKAEPTILDLTQKEKLASDHIIELEAKLRDLTAERDQLKSELEEKTLRVDEQNIKIDNLYARLGAASAEDDKAANDAISLGTALRVTEEQVASLQRELAHVRAETSTSMSSIKDLQAALASAEQDNIAVFVRLMEFVSANQGSDMFVAQLIDKITEVDAECKLQREARERKLGLKVLEGRLTGKELEDTRRATEEVLRLKEEARRAAELVRKKDEEDRLAKLAAEPVVGKCSLTFVDLFNVRMVINAARNLPPHPEGRSRNPYASVKVNDGTRKTKIKNDTLEPEWKQPFGFITEKMPKELSFDVWDHTGDESQPQHLGSIVVPIAALFHGQDNGEVNNFFPLAEAAQGELSVKITCKRVPQATLRWTAGYGHEDIAKVLHFANADVDAKEKGGRTSLMQAAMRDMADAAHTLLLSGANCEAKDSNGLNPLLLASIYNSTHTIPILLQHKANIECLDALGRSPLIMACKNGRADAARILIEHKADMNAVDADGLTALMIASVEGHAPVVKMLIEHGAEVRLKNRHGLNPLMMAAVRDHAEVARVCLTSGADPNDRDSMGMSPLMIAAVRGNLEVVKVLIESHSDLNPTETNGRTPLMFASHMGRYDVVRALLEAGADINRVDTDGRTCLQIAMDNKQHNVARLLQQWISDNAPQPGV